MKKIYLWVLLGSLTAISIFLVLFFSLKPQSISSTGKNCETGFKGLQYEFSASRTAGKISSSVRLIKARDKRSFRFLTFVGDLQVITPSFSPVSVDCGETKKVEYSPEKFSEDSVVNILIRELPVIPDRLIKRNLSDRFEGTESFLLDYALDRSDFKTLQSNKRKPYFISEDSEKTELVPAKLNDGYIFFFRSDVPNHVFYTTKNKTPFGLYFSDVPDKLNRVYTITCLLNDRQVYAFNNERSWSGRMNRGQGVYLKGEVALNSGWNQLRCVILNNLYDQDLPMTLYPENIRATYIYSSGSNARKIRVNNAGR